MTPTQDPWMAAMRRGDFESAWRRTDELEARRRLRPPDENNLLWDGTDPTDRDVFVRCLHGLGDSIQFSRFLPRLHQRAARLTIAVQPSLVPLFQHQGFGSIQDGWNCWENRDGALEIEIMELAYVYRVTPSTLPPPSLRVPRRKLLSAPICQLLRSPSPRIAIFWAASGWGDGRRVPLALFEALGQLSGIEFFSFQQGPCESEAERSCLSLRRLSKFTTGILDLAFALAQMDLVISVDTMAAHLAASLRVPVWLLLERVADWRWIEGRNDSPWYPEMRIFREQSGWKKVIDRVQEALEKFSRTQLSAGTCDDRT
jgi:hypothetical protein